MTSKRTRDDGPIPELGAGSPRPSRTDPHGSGPPPRPSKSDQLGGTTGDAFFGSGTFDAGDFGDSLDLALDDGTDTRLGSLRAHAALDGDVIERTAEGARSLPARPLVEDGPWPTGVSPGSASIEIDPAELELTAEYGPAPTGVLGTPAYAVRTLLRRRALAERVRELSVALSAAESARDQLLTALLTTLDPLLRGTAEGLRLLEPVSRIGALADEKRAALSGVNTEYEQRLAELDATDGALEAEAASAAAGVESAARSLAERKHAHDRLEARKKRLYIEVRAVLDAVEKAGGQATPEQTAIIQAREADAAAQKPELERAAQSVRAATAEHEAALAVSKDVARRRAELARSRAGLGTEFQKRAGAHSHGVDEAETHRVQAAVDAARAVLAAKGRIVDVPRGARDEILRADDRVAVAARDLERHVRAVDAYDRSAVTTGFTITAGVVAAVLLVLLLLSTR